MKNAIMMGIITVWNRYNPRFSDHDWEPDQQAAVMADTVCLAIVTAAKVDTSRRASVRKFIAGCRERSEILTEEGEGWKADVWAMAEEVARRYIGAPAMKMWRFEA